MEVVEISGLPSRPILSNDRFICQVYFFEEIGNNPLQKLLLAKSIVGIVEIAYLFAYTFFFFFQSSNSFDRGN